MTDAIPSKETELAPDPDEDDLDDLDGTIEELSLTCFNVLEHV